MLFTDMKICLLILKCYFVIQYIPNVLILHPAAAWKLIGKVRIANVRYSESFRNASSQEYRDFLELFFRTVSW